MTREPGVVIVWVTALLATGWVAVAPHNIVSLILITSLLLALGIGWITGGSFDQLLGTPIRGVWVITFLVFVSVDLWVASHFTDSRVLYWIYLAQMAAAGIWITFNAASQPSRGLRFSFGLVALGWAMNFLAIVANGGMPVPAHVDDSGAAASMAAQVEHVLSYRTVQLTENTRLPWLADAYEIPVTLQIVSLGDITVILGLVLFAGFGMHNPTEGDFSTHDEQAIYPAPLDP